VRATYDGDHERRGGLQGGIRPRERTEQESELHREVQRREVAGYSRRDRWTTLHVDARQNQRTLPLLGHAIEGRAVRRCRRAPDGRGWEVVHLRRSEWRRLRSIRSCVRQAVIAREGG